MAIVSVFSPEKHGYEPQNTKCHCSPQIIFFRHFLYFSLTEATHTYVLAKFEKNSIFLFSTPLLDFNRQPLLRHND